MEIIDKHFLALSTKRKAFLATIALVFTAVAVVAYFTRLTSVLESLLIFIIGTIYGEMMKLYYRIEELEKRKK